MKVPLPDRFIPYSWKSQGCDPEVFITDASGAIVPSMLVVPEDGIQAEKGSLHVLGGKVVRDGVQVELHPEPSSCRQCVSQNLRLCLEALQKHLPVGWKVDWRPVVTLNQDEFARLPDEAKVLGCMPSFNAYGPRNLQVDPNHPVRSAGGHIHLATPEIAERITKDPGPIVWLLDVILGCTSVLLDRDPRAAERRELYGRAGEFRLPSYGLEYRTLSNFWLQHNALHGMVYAGARLALALWAADNGKSLLSRVDLTHVQDAINQNDYSKALEAVKVLSEYIEELGQAYAMKYYSALNMPWRKILDNQAWVFLPPLDEFLAFAEVGIGAMGRQIGALNEYAVEGWEKFRMNLPQWLQEKRPKQKRA